jgi:hypothetical protein
VSDFEFDFEIVDKMNEIYKAEPRNNNREICACGHAMSRHRHDKMNNVWLCKPGQLSCDCGHRMAVIEVPNTRYFMRKSKGSGEKHALPRGIAASIKALGDEFEAKKKWLIPPVCGKCGVEAKYYPVRVNAIGEILTDEQYPAIVLTAFLCPDCRK